MSIIYAPYIDGTLLPFYLDNTTINIRFPIEHNIAVGHYEAMFIKIMDLNNNILYSPTIGKSDAITEDGYFVWSDTVAQEDTFLLGNYYKLQIAYHDKTSIQDISEIKAWSSVGIIKCTAKPVVALVTETTIIDENGNEETYALDPWYLQYQTADVTEKPYEYELQIKSKGEEILYSLGTQKILIQGEWDGEYSVLIFKINFKPNCIIPQDSLFHYSFKTINGLVIEGNITNNKIQQDAPGEEINVILNNEEGYVKTVFNQQAIVYKSNSQDFEKWVEFNCVNGIFIDNTLEHQKECWYRASIDPELETEGQKTAILDFEDMFLSDETCQLRIRYNPKVSSFKKTILEQKTDTIGSPYPYFFRNGNIGYKEIPISGLISYHMDNEELFMSKEELGLLVDKKDISTINLSGYNVAAERKFKLKVLDWLTNGKPKLFRSPTEGNYIIRLMNVSLSPEEKLGRMIHTFSATGYEVEEWNDENVAKYILGGAGK